MSPHTVAAARLSVVNLLRTMPSDTLAFTDLLELSDLLLTSGQVRLRIASRSMAPTLRPGDEITVEPASIEEVRVGELILFERQGRLICHRLVEVAGQSPAWLTRGDASRGAGEQISREQVLGKVVAIRKRSLWVGLQDAVQRAFLPLLLRWLPSLQQRGAYRLLLRPFIVPFLTHQLGLAQGSRWYQWQKLRTVDGLPNLPHSARPHLLVAKVGRNMAGHVHLTRTGVGWHCEDLAVRIRYRGLGIESDLTRLAHLLFHAQQTADASLWRPPSSLKGNETLRERRRPEDQIVLLTARPELSNAHKQHLQALVRHHRVDWGYLLRVSQRHMLGSLLYHHLSGCEWTKDEIPPGILEGPRQHYYATACQNTLRLQEAGRVLNALREEGIPVMALKGLALAEPLYHDIALRPMGDIDVMIRPGDYRRLTALLEQMGYVCSMPARQRLARERFGCNLEFISRATGGNVDLHWDLATYERLKGVVTLDAEEFWQRSVVQTLAGCPVRALCPEHLLLYQAFDAGFMHGFNRLLGGCDVVRVLETFAPALDWDLILASARGSGVQSLLYAVLFWAHRLWEAPVPEGVLKTLRPPSGFRRRLIERLAGWRVQQDHSGRRRYVLQFLLLDGAGAMARVCRRVLIPSDDWLMYFYALRNPRFVFPLRLLHPLLLPFHRRLR